jgi:hypothetical protein
MQKWIYIGPGHDPHVVAHVPGMSRVTEHEITKTVIAAVVPPIDALPFVVRVTRLPEIGGEGGATALAFRERWKTQLSPEPVFSLFVTRGTDGDPDELLTQAQVAFPSVWLRYEKLLIGEICEKRFAPRSSEASVSTTPTAAPPSKPGKASAKSSA